MTADASALLAALAAAAAATAAVVAAVAGAKVALLLAGGCTQEVLAQGWVPC
jgi:hypothetical protein